MAQETGTMKLRSKYFQKGYPVQLTYPTLKIKITWDGDGLADVPTAVAKKLLDKNEFGDNYELYVPEEKKHEKEPKRAPKVVEENKEKEFIDTIKG